MLLYVDRSAKDCLESSGSDREDAIRSLTNLATSRREGKHLILGNQAALRAIASWDELDRYSLGVYSKILQETVEKGNLRKELKYRIDIVWNPAGVPSEQRSSGQRIVQLPLHHFRYIDRALQTLLLTENKRDAQIYEIMARVSLKRRSWKLPLRMENRAGGGDDMAAQYVDIQSNKKICLCIADSDKTSFQSGCGDTANKIMRRDDALSPTCSYVVTEAHELENLISTRTYDETLDRNNPLKERQRAASIRFLERLEATKFAEIRQFLDFKNGLRLSVVLDNLEAYGRYRDKDYWNCLLHIAETQDSVDPNCIENQRCKKDRKKECSCVVMDGFGKGVIDAVIEKLNEKAPGKIRENLCGNTAPEWQRIGDTLLAWSCGSSELRS